MERGMTLTDMVVTFFIFAIAATYLISFQKRAAVAGLKNTYWHFVRRYFAIMGIGALFGAFESVWTDTTVWGTLHTIGLAGLLTLPVIRLSTTARAAIGLALLGVNQLGYHLAPGLYVGEIGAVLRALSIAATLIICTALVDLFHRGMKPFVIASGFVIIAAVVPLLLGAPYTKRNMVSFALVSIAASCVYFLGANLLNHVLPNRPGLVSWWGENPMLLYILHLMLIGAARAFDPRSMWLAVPLNLMILSILSVIAWQLHRKKIVVAL